MATLDEGLEDVLDLYASKVGTGRSLRTINVNRKEAIQAILDLMCKHRGCDNPLLPYDEDAPAPRKILGPCACCGKEAR